MHKKIILISLLILTLLLALLAYLNNIFLPVKLKEIIIREASKKLHRSVAIESLYYVPLKGLVFHNVDIRDKAPQTEKIFSAQEISISIFYIPLIFQKKVIIPSLVIDDPTVMISRERTGEWNFQDLFSPPERKTDTSAFSAYIAGLTINNGTILFFDKNISRDAIEKVEHISIRASLSLPQNMKATIKVFPRNSDALKIFADLNYDFISKNFICQLRAENLSLEKFSAYVNHPGFAVQKARLDVAALDLFQRDGKISGHSELVFDAVQMQLQGKDMVTLLPTITLSEINGQKDQWHIKGRINAKQAQCAFEGNRRIAADMVYDFAATYSDKKMTAEGNISSVNLSGEAGKDLSFAVQPQGKLSLAFVNTTAEIKTQLKLPNTQITFKPNAQFTDDLLLDFWLTNNPSPSGKTPLQYSLALSFNNGKITNLPVVQAAENISGKILLTPNKLAAESLTALVSQTPVSFSGVVENFQDPWLNVHLGATNLDLGAWKNLSNQYLPKNDIDIKGIATFQVKYKGKLKKMAGSSIEGTLSLKDAAFKNKLIPEGIVGISGDIAYMVASLNTSHYLPDAGSWKDITLTFQGKTYQLNGTLKFNNLDTIVKRDDLSLTLNSKLFPDRLKVLGLTAQYKKTNVSVKGEVFYPKDNNGPRLNLDGTGSVALEDLSDLFPSLKEKIKPIDPQGICTINGLFAGVPTQWQDWSLALTLKSDRIRLYGYAFDQLLIKYDQRDRFINNLSISSSFYDGLLTTQGSSDLSITEMPYKMTLDIKNMNFAKLKNDTALKDKDISGTLTATYAGTGPLSNLLLSQGQGSFSIKNGKLWQFEIFKGLAQLLFVPGKENITLDSAESNFSIVNQKVLVKDALIKGNQVELSCNGTATFQGELDFDIVSRFGEGVIRSSDSLQKTIAAFLSQAEDFLTVKVTGTLKKPEYKVIPKPLNVIQKTKDFIFDALPNIFQ